MVTTRDAQQLFDALDFPSPDSVTERAVEWMRDNLDPGDVFTDEKLRDWAMANGFVEAE